jgi:hypothetical protein
MRVPRQHVLVLVDPTPHSVGSMMEAGPENVLDVLELLEPFMEFGDAGSRHLALYRIV